MFVDFSMNEKINWSRVDSQKSREEHKRMTTEHPFSSSLVPFE